jgi:sugar transferase (PEP-CTERM/EpsH1 system associated)
VNLLFLTPQLPHPPRQGTAIRNWGLIRHLVTRHRITLLSFAEEGQSVTPELGAACARVISVPAPRRSRMDRLRTLFSPEPDLARRLWSPDFARAVSSILSEGHFDVVHFEGLETTPYLNLFKLQPQPQSRPKLLYDAHNAEHVIQQRAFLTDIRMGGPRRWPAAIYSWLQLPRLKRFEASSLRAVDHVTCVSPEDAAVLRHLVPELQPVLVPNGIDVSDYTHSAFRYQPSASSQQPSARIVFTGKMDYRPNVDAAVWFADAVWPLIRAAQPQAEFVIVGQKPAPAVQALNGRGGVRVTGAVDDARPYIAGAAVYVAPLRLGGGTRFKLLEAMALARPIVSTAIGAEGFAVQPGRELCIADTPDGFAQAVLKLLGDTAYAQSMGQAGRAFVQANYDWSMIIPRLEAVYGD